MEEEPEEAVDHNDGVFVDVNIVAGGGFGVDSVELLVEEFF